MVTLKNTDIAELLARDAEEADGHRRRAYLRASRAALGWDEEASEVVARGGSLTELHGIGPRLAAKVDAWLADAPDVPEPPELRRGFLSFAQARVLLREQPAWREALRGDLQMHTERSDGQSTAEEMARACAGRGYEYIAVTDHSKGLAIAGGIDEDALLEQRAEIDRLNEVLYEEGTTLRVLRSLELNLSVDGEGDMEPDALGGLDIVLGSFHGALRVREDQTDRYVAALRNPHVQILGHPRGRKYNLRLGLRADWERVLGTAAELGKALEVNAFPDRQDLDVELLEMARDAGAYVSIGTDAHNVFELRFIDLGLAATLVAGISPDRILNFKTRQELVEWSRSLQVRT